MKYVPEFTGVPEALKPEVDLRIPNYLQESYISRSKTMDVPEEGTYRRNDPILAQVDGQS